MGCCGRLFPMFRSNMIAPIGDVSDKAKLKTDFSVFCTSNKLSDKIKVEVLKTEDGIEIITEESAEHLILDVVKRFEENENIDLELSIVGKQCPRRMNAREKARHDEQKVLEKLRQEGLIPRLTGQTKNSVSFEIVQERPKSAAGPARLQNVRQRVELTEDEIREKLAMAERRKKAREEERILKIRAMEKTEPAEVIEAFKQKQKLKEEEFTRKMNEVVAARAKRLRDIRDDLKKKDKHAKLVRARKDLNLDDMDPVPSVDE